MIKINGKQMKLSGPAIILLVVVIIFSIFSKNFFSLSNGYNIIRQASVLALIAFGQTFVILVGGIDLSVGAIMGLTSTSTALLMLNGMNPIAALLVGLLVGLLAGTINGVVINYIGLNHFIGTFGMQGMALGIALVIADERVVFGFPDTLRVLHDGMLFNAIPVPLLIVLFFFLLFTFILKKTAWGIATYAVGGNEESAKLSGIYVVLHKTILYAMSGLMAGAAGMMFLARANSAQALDTIGYEFDAICAVVLGGTSLAGGKGGIGKTLLGVFLYTIIRNGMNMIGINLYLQLVVLGVIIIFAYIAEEQSERISTFFNSIKRKKNKEQVIV